MHNTKIHIAFLAVFCILFSCSNQQGKNVNAGMQIKGSDTIVNLVQVWAEKFSQINDGKNVGVTGGGTGTGFAALLNNTCDIAMASRQVEENEINLAKKQNITYKEFIVGLDGLAVLVNKDNPINYISIDQLRDIFMAKITNWKEIGGEDRPIVLLSRESNSGTHMFFKETVIRLNDINSKDEFSPKALLMPSSQAIVDEIYQNPNAIGYAGIGFMNDQTKALSVSAQNSIEYFYPTIENVMYGRYPISRPLYLYTNGEPKGIVKDFIDYALSEEGQKVVVETAFVPIKTEG
ncbi:phosphate ABC transporter substrate-binding protein [Candidatus Ruminimicrobiellum ovillum]|uniref:phosphate ABC transporter substrate-binding protein n=1 Tax=Candidatus Ruminimicrobiellum ovillum TaxID=1947927 RepID=UPI00355A3292